MKFAPGLTATVLPTVVAPSKHRHPLDRTVRKDARKAASFRDASHLAARQGELPQSSTTSLLVTRSSVRQPPLLRNLRNGAERPE